MRVPYLAAAMPAACARRHWRKRCCAATRRRQRPVADYKLPAGFADISFADKAPRALRWARAGRGKMACPAPEDSPEQMHGCGKCAEICPGHTITVENGKAHIVPRACIRCFCCHEMCPVKAIDVKRAGIFNL